jgi:UDP-glucose 4-epimerase
VNILLTGGTGYIGSHTAITLLESGLNVFLLDNLSNSKIDVVEKIEKITGKAIVFIEADIRNKSLISSTLKKYKIDAVMHFAGLKAVGDSTSNPLEYYDNNVAGTIALIQAMQVNSVTKIVFSSSATVYGNPHYLPIDELHPTEPTNPYGKTKLHIEQILKDLCLSDTSWKVLCLRYFNPVGADHSGLVGENPNGVPNNLMPFISGVASGKYPYVKIFGKDFATKDGTGIRDYIHVLDLSEGHLAGLNFLNDVNGWHVFNLGTGKGTSVLEMIDTFSKVSGKKIPFKFHGRRTGDVAECYASPEKASKMLNWKAKRNLDLMCASAWKWQESLK